ncbi:MAG: N-acetyltransferase family protein [Dehalococcoidia bacterium]
MADRLPRTVTMRDASKLELRLMTAADGPLIKSFAATLSPDDLLFLRNDITSDEGLQEWLDNTGKGNTISVLALSGKDLAGYALVSRNPARWTRRLGEIRVNIGPGRRGTGLGSVLVSEIFDQAREAGLRKLTAQMTPDQAGARAVFEHLGFQVEALLTDWVEDRQGRTRDLIVMAYDLDGFTDRVDEPLRS